MNWLTPTKVKEIQSFLGLCNYYRRFVFQFALITFPLTRLTHKDVLWQWTSIKQTAFDVMKKKLTEAPILWLPNPEKQFYLHVDVALTMAVGGILSQEQSDDKLLHPVAFESKMMSKAEQNYPVHEQELLALKHCLDKWRHYLDTMPFTVYTDNRLLETIRTNRNLSKRQIRWLERFQSFQFSVHHLPRVENGGADALSK